MKSYLSLFKNGRFQGALAGAGVAALFTAATVFGATTISTSITTGGNLTVSGTAAITGASTLTGLTTMGYASSTSQSLTGNLQVAGGLAVGSAVTNSLAGTVLLSAQTSDPTGVTQGTFYYNSTSKVLKMFDGTDWFTVGTTTSGISLVGARLQLGDLTTQYLTLGTTTQQGSGKSLVTLEATTTTSVPLSLVGYTSQTGHLLDILNSSSAKLLYISSSGGLFGSSTAAFGGTLTVGGDLAATSTLTVTGLASLNGQASTTRLSVFDTLYVGGTSTTTITGNNTASTIAYASTTAITATTASTTNLIVGGNSTNGTIAGIIFGTCDLQQTSITASTTLGVQCSSATGVSTAYKVFVTATSSLATHLASPSNGFAIVAASSTGANLIGVTLSNLTGAANSPAGTLNFWAVR
jgi:hypothetical protein